MKTRTVAFGLAAVIAAVVAGWVGLELTNGNQTSIPPQPTTNFMPSSPSIPSTSELPPVPKASPTFGTFVSEVPASAPESTAAKKTIDEVHDAGLNLVYQYSLVQGTTELDRQYLDYAQSHGVRVVIDLHDLYDGLDVYPQGGNLAGWLAVLSQNFGQHFTTTDEVVDYMVQTFASHPTVWGFSASDEQPEGPEGLAVWSQLLMHRYQQIREQTHKPVLLTMMGDQPASFFKSLEGRGDQLATDYYPVGNKSIAESDALTRIGHDVTHAGWHEPWAILQAFDMRDPEYGMPMAAMPTAHFPTLDELVQMGRQAHDSGVSGMLFFAWGSVQQHGQQATIKAAVAKLQELYKG